MICTSCNRETHRTRTIWDINGRRRDGCNHCVHTGPGVLLFQQEHSLDGAFPKGKKRPLVTVAHCRDIEKRKLGVAPEAVRTEVYRDRGTKHIRMGK